MPRQIMLLASRIMHVARLEPHHYFEEDHEILAYLVHLETDRQEIFGFAR